VDEGQLEMAAARERAKKTLRSAVAVVRGKNYVARTEEVKHERYRGHAGVRDHSARSVLQLGDGVGEKTARRVAATRVVELTRPVECLEGEVRRQMKGRDDGAM